MRANYEKYTKTPEGRKKVKEILEEGRTKAEVIAKQNYESLLNKIKNA